MTLKARITGDLAGLLTFMNAKPPTGGEPDGGVGFELVAGARCQRQYQGVFQATA